MVPEIPLKIGNCQNNQAGSLTKKGLKLKGDFWLLFCWGVK